MPTKSILKNIVLSDRKSVRDFVGALEKAKNQKCVQTKVEWTEVKGNDINVFFEHYK